MSPGKSFQIAFISVVGWGSNHPSVHCTLASTIGSQFVLGLLDVTLLPVSLNTRRNTLLLPCFVTAFSVSCGITLSSPSHKSILHSRSFLLCHIKNLFLDHERSWQGLLPLAKLYSFWLRCQTYYENTQKRSLTLISCTSPTHHQIGLLGLAIHGQANKWYVSCWASFSWHTPTPPCKRSYFLGLGESIWQ